MNKHKKLIFIIALFIITLLVGINIVYGSSLQNHEDVRTLHDLDGRNLSENNRSSWLGAALVIIQLTSFIISIFLFLYGILKYFIVKSKYEKTKKEEVDSDNKNKYTIEYVNKCKTIAIELVIISIILFGASGILGIIRTFAAKPIIYIYPEDEAVVEIKLSNPERLSCSYPKYNDSWKVLAKPNGDLLDLKTNRKLYALYWEGHNIVNLKKRNEGFCIKGEDSAEFLEEKLEILGLNERESEEFIVYWLPVLEKNKYNYIRFESMDEINENMALEINPKPDTIIRVMMEFKGLNWPIKVTEQKLERVERNGYTVVEWGGTKLK